MDQVENNPVIQFEDSPDPVIDIIDYLVRSANISFKNANVSEQEIRTSEKVRIAYDLYQQSPASFLLQFGKNLTSHHIKYFENIKSADRVGCKSFADCIQELKEYHSEEAKHKRVRNRRYRALQKMQQDTDYFSEKEMMFRSPLLYEQLIGQFLTENEIKKRDNVDAENLTLLNMILETVDRNEMREARNEQMLEEDIESEEEVEKKSETCSEDKPKRGKQWGDFETPDTRPSHKPDIRNQALISAPERKLLREEFYHEMYNSFLEGRDPDVDYVSIDNDDQYDDLQQASQDAEDKYFDSETNEVENLEEHMNLVSEYKKSSSITADNTEDSLEKFMEHINKKL